MSAPINPQAYQPAARGGMDAPPLPRWSHAQLCEEDAEAFRAVARRVAAGEAADGAPLAPLLAFCLARRGAVLDARAPFALEALACAYGHGFVVAQDALRARARVTDAGTLELRWEAPRRRARRVRRAA